MFAPAGNADQRDDFRAPPSNFRRAHISLGKHLFHREQSDGQALFVGVPRHGGQYLVVFSHPVGPEVLPHDPARFLVFGVDPWQPDLEGGGFGKLGFRESLRLKERFVDTRGKPPMLVQELTLNTDRMHDRKESGSPVVIALYGPIIRKQSPHLWVPVNEARRPPGGYDRIDSPI